MLDNRSHRMHAYLAGQEVAVRGPFLLVIQSFLQLVQLRLQILILQLKAVDLPGNRAIDSIHAHSLFDKKIEYLLVQNNSRSAHLVQLSGLLRVRCSNGSAGSDLVNATTTPSRERE